ncbi:MAG: hypothetical protein J7K82_07055 [Thermoproteales archaeon]|nr:hypothetical protein [Thermoproteales archaeon]
MYKEAILTAEKHYNSLMENDYKTWLETLSKDIKENADIKGSTAYFWWETGRRYVEKYGVRYEFHKIDARYSSKNRVKIFFKRLNPDGSLRGSPVPIVLIVENHEWKVVQASY